MGRSQEFGEQIYRGFNTVSNVVKAVQRGFRTAVHTAREVRAGIEIEKAEIHKKPTDVEIGDTLADLGYRDCVYTSCSVYRGQEASMVEAGRIRMIKTNIEHNSPGIAGGLALGGRKAMLMSQNSALFNEGDGTFTFLSSKVNDIPVLAFISWRRDMGSEPHGEIGRITDGLTQLMFGKDQVFGKEDGSDFIQELTAADQVVESGHMAIVLMPEEAFETIHEPLPYRRSEEEVANVQEVYKITLQEEARIARLRGTFTETNPFLTNKAFDRFEAAQMVVEHYRKHFKNVRFVVSNGFNARTFLAIYGDDPDFLYVPGYMGGANAIGAGLGWARLDVRFVVLNGNENNQMSPMVHHLKTDYPDNVEIVTFNDGAASSVGGAPSRPLTSDDWNFSRVIQINGVNYFGFSKNADRVQNSPQHTKEFALALRLVPIAGQLEASELFASEVAESGRLPQL